MEKSLQMVFQNQLGKNVTMNLAGVKDDLTDTQIKTLMQLIVSKNVFESSGGDLISVMSASIIARDVQDITVR